MASSLLRVLFLGAAILAIGPAHAVEPDEILADTKLEQRARKLSAELRCLVCQNQSIDDSNAPLARDLRLLVRERIKAGDDDKAVMSFIVARYGEFVLLRPPVVVHTLILWLAPLALLLGGIIMVRRAMRRSGSPRTEPTSSNALTPEEKARLEKLLKRS